MRVPPALRFRAGIPDRQPPGTGPGPGSGRVQKRQDPYHGHLGETRHLPMSKPALHKGSCCPEARYQGNSEVLLGGT